MDVGFIIKPVFYIPVKTLWFSHVFIWSVQYIHGSYSDSSSNFPEIPVILQQELNKNHMQEKRKKQGEQQEEEGRGEYRGRPTCEWNR